MFTIALASGLVAVTLLGSRVSGESGLDPAAISGALFAVAVGATIATILLGLRRHDPYLEPRLFRNVEFSSAVLVSLLTGYAFATAIIGGAVFVDRVLYGGPDVQRIALGSLAGATAIGALASGFAVRVLSLRLVTLVGLAASGIALAVMTRWSPTTTVAELALVLGLFGLGFGLTVTPRSTAAVEAVGRQAFGMASATVTVARMIGMAVGLAVLTAYGSTTIERLFDAVYATPESYKLFIPEALRNRILEDGLVVQALEAWAAGEAAQIMVPIFLAAGVLTIVAVLPALAMGRRTRMLAPGSQARDAGPTSSRSEPDAQEDVEPTLAL